MKLDQTRPLTAAAVLVLAALTTPAQAQSYGGRTWGQPYYGAYSHPSPLSEAEPETHARLGAAGGGYTWGSGPILPRGYGHGGYGGNRGYSYDRSGYGHAHGHRYDRPSQPGYRDEWGYNDDRPPSRWRSGSTRPSRDYAYRSCGCSDVYLYDR